MTGSKSSRELLWSALTKLAPNSGATKLDDLVVLIDSAMTAAGRHYHDLDHALMVAESNDPLDTLIGLFQDIVQTGVDGGLPPGCNAYLTGLVGRNSCGEFYLDNSTEALNDPVFGIVKRCFNFSDSYTLSPFFGQNEFLSALIACKALSHLLDVDHLAAIALGIEATVPFRKDSHLITASYLVALADIKKRYQLRLEEPEMRSHIRRAVRIANRDVHSFSEPDLLIFLDETWGLMYESCSELRAGGSVSVTSYRQTLQRMTRFLSSLAAPVIFRQYDGEPIQSDHQHRLESTARNLEVIADVMHAKLLATSLIESADSFGCRSFIPARLKSMLRMTTTASGMSALDVLAAGSAGKVEFDIRQSPLSHKLLLQLHRDEIRAHINAIDFASPVSNRLIEQFPTDIQSRARELARAMLL